MVMAERRTWMPGGSRGARPRRPSCAGSPLLAHGRGAGSHRVSHSPAAARLHRRGLRTCMKTASVRSTGILPVSLPAGQAGRRGVSPLLRHDFHGQDARGTHGQARQGSQGAAHATVFIHVLSARAAIAYYYRVRAYNDIGDGEYSDVASATTPWPPTALATPMDHLAMAVAKRSDGHVVPGEFYAYDYDGIGNRGLMRNGQVFVAIVAIYRRGAKKPG